MSADDGGQRCPECGISLVTDPDTNPRRCSTCGYFRRRLPTVGVAMVVRDDRGRILLGRRAHGPEANLWCIPCGRLEWDEAVRQAAERELLEETGLTARAGKVVAVHSNFHDRKRQTVGIWFAAEDVNGTPHCADGELVQVGYFDPAHPPELAFPTDALVLAQLAEERPVAEDDPAH
jgi:ADP-ribose pyrophosphatase YjhB (NUDIX family)